MSNILVRLFGFPALLVHGDLLVADRWRWLKKRLPKTRNGETLIDVGCGSGAFTIGTVRRGYRSVGLSWDARNQAVAHERAAICGVEAQFPIVDVRQLDQQNFSDFDFAICFENIEHVLGDLKLMKDIAATLKPGGRLLLTAPNYYYRAMTPSDDGPFLTVETGWHVRRGYSAAMLRELCRMAALEVEEIASCSGFVSQKVTALMRVIKPYSLGWLIALPFRLLPWMLDPLITRLTGWPDYSICMVAYKPRFAKS